MRPTEPPKLALRLLDRFVPDNEPLTGDLLEEFERRPSRLSFWKQTLAALVITATRKPGEIRPLRLVDDRGTGRRPGRVDDTHVRPRQFNLSASPIKGIGGLSFVLLVALATVTVPQLWWWVVAASVVAGLVLGVFLILVSKRRIASRATGAAGAHLILAVEPAPVAPDPDAARSA